MRRFSRLNSGISFTADGRKTSPDEGTKFGLFDRICWLFIVDDDDDCWVAITREIGLELFNTRIYNKLLFQDLI